ncbi:MAG: hypothetical protein NTZ33_05095 [Bacteroidetes bacterium]|nr:hypothetical protein [Bacteroidota bacterium]
MRKIISIFYFMAILLLMINNASAQDLKTNLAALKQKIGEVQVDKVIYRQSFDILDEEKAKVIYTSIEVDEKGKTKKESYEFYVSDIDKNTIFRKTSGKKLFVSVAINNNQKFIKYFVDDQLDSYVNKIDLLVLDADIAQIIMDVIKTSIPMVKSSEKSWDAITDALNWLKANIGQVKTKAGITAQGFGFGERKDYLASLLVKETDVKGAIVEKKYEFNVMDINKNDLTVKISGAQLSVNIEMKGGDKYIKCFKNNEQQSFDNNIEILAQDIDQARNIIAAFGHAILKSRSKFQEFTSLQQAIDFLKAGSADMIIDGKTYKQKLSFQQDQGNRANFSLIESDGKSKNSENLSICYLSDLELNSLNFKISGKKILLLCNTKNNVEFVKTIKDNVLQNYEKNIELLYTDIETTREMIEALKFAIKAADAKPMTWNSVAEAMLFLNHNIKGEAVLSDQYKLSFSNETTEPYKSEYGRSKTDAKGAITETKFSFYPYMLEANTTRIKSSGKYLNVITTVKNKASFIKIIKDSKQQSYDNELEIMAFDSKQAKEIAEAIKYIALNAKPAPRDWTDKKKNMEYVKENIGNLKGEGIEIKQKLELVNGDPCKLNLTVNTTDDKGKTIDEIYEFSLADMNKMMVDYKISGKNVIVILVCKNKEKFVKIYKNGQQQTYGSEINILDDDVEDARNLADAFRNSIIQCEKQ